MKQQTLIEIILGTVGGLTFSVGMCLCLISEWNLFAQGCALSLAGFGILLCIIPVYRKFCPRKEAKKINKGLFFTIISEILGALILGTGMSKILVGQASQTEMMIGIIIGVAGILICVLTYPIYTYRKAKK